MKAIRYFTMAATLVATMGCQDEELLQRSYLTDPNAVHISATVGDTPTRSNPAGDATTAMQFNPGDKIAVSSGNQAAVVYSFDGGTSWAPVDESKYLVWNSNKQNFTAYYPETYTGSGNVPQEQHTEKLIAAADYMKFDSEMEKQETVSFTMARQTARVVIHSTFKWGSEYKDAANAPTYKVDAIQVNCIGVSDIKPYQPDHYYALVNSGSADPNATFLTITISPLDGQGTSVTHTVKGIPVFQAGYSYTYNLTIGKNGVTISDVTVEDWSTGSILPGEGNADDDVTPIFMVKAPAGNFTYSGGSKTYTVYSRVWTANDTQVALPWTAKFVRQLENGTYEEIKQGDADYPTWITSFTDKGIGTDPEQECVITVKPKEITNVHYDALKNNPPVSGTYNLANAKGGDDIENTANCYIINAAGTYSFPLVYGNAIKNGADNKSAYISNIQESDANYDEFGLNTLLKNFLNHKDAPITNPYIAANEGCTPNNATLVWQDAENLVSNIQFVDGGSPEKHRITFDVAQSSIKQGNAIIAVRDAENSILWSWHIWVTDYVPLQSATKMDSYNPAETQRDKQVWNVDNSRSYTYMGVPLGWCDPESSKGNEVMVQFTQPETGQTEVITIKQEALGVGGNCTYYQWGRKDPMLPSNGLGNDDKTHNGNYLFTKGLAGKITLGKSIQSPHELYDGVKSGHYQDWYDADGNYYHNLWDTHNITVEAGDVIGTKTVYDPSPVGYIVPPRDAITGFTYNGGNIGGNTPWQDRNQLNTPFDSSDDFAGINGWVFYCKGMNNQQGQWNTDGGVIFFPAVGFRSCNEDLIDGNPTGRLEFVNEYAGFLTTTQCGKSQVREFEIDLNRTWVTNGKTVTSHCMPVRPIREQ